MKLSHRIESKVLMVSFTGNLVLDETIEAKHYVMSLIDDPTIRGMILNCGQMSYLDSSGVGWIASVYKSLNSRQLPLILCGLNSRGQKVLELIGMTKILKFYDTENDALYAMSEGIE